MMYDPAGNQHGTDLRCPIERIAREQHKVGDFGSLNGSESVVDPQ